MGGGAVALVSSAIGMIASTSSQKGPSDQSSRQHERLKAEREAQEESQRKREADDRKRERDKVLDARAIEKKRLAEQDSGKTTLVNGGAGLLTDPKVKKNGLKEKFGE